MVSTTLLPVRTAVSRARALRVCNWGASHSHRDSQECHRCNFETYFHHQRPPMNAYIDGLKLTLSRSSRSRTNDCIGIRNRIIVSIKQTRQSRRPTVCNKYPVCKPAGPGVHLSREAPGYSVSRAGTRFRREHLNVPPLQFNRRLLNNYAQQMQRIGVLIQRRMSF
jgi:hypothetical protein